MSDDLSKEKDRRDDLLLRLLKTPPKPRPKRGRGKEAPLNQDRASSANDDKPEPSA